MPFVRGNRGSDSRDGPIVTRPNAPGNGESPGATPQRGSLCVDIPLVSCDNDVR